MLTGAPTERGFTLIEMLVAMIVATIVLAVFVSMVTQAWVRTADADSHGLASARISEALDRIADDVRSSRIPARADIFTTATKDELRVQLQAEPVRYGDVVHASGQRLSLFTNGDGSGAGPRCATWSFQQVDDGGRRNVWALTRRLDGACTPAATEGQEIIGVLPEGISPPSNAFRYGVLGAPDGTGVCGVQVTSPGRATLDARSRLRVVNVHVDLTAAAARRVSARSRVARDVIGMGSRLNNDYYFALGCAA